MEVLIKAVATVVPTYSMNYFKFPKKWCSEVNNILAKFWWRQKDKERKTNWKKWTDMTEPKWKGGLGFKDLEDFN